MIFCRRCGRYYDNGTRACGACGADLKVNGHASFQGTPVTLAIAVADTNTSASVETPSETLMDETQTLSSDVEASPLFDRDKFLLRQKALAIKEKYYVTDDAGSPLMFVERPALLAQQIMMLAAVAVTFFGGNFVMSFISGMVGSALGPGVGLIFSAVGVIAVLVLSVVVFFSLMPKRHISFYTDDTKTEKMLEIQQMNKLEFPYANFNILDKTGNLIGRFRKNILWDYIRRRWDVMNANGLHLCTAKEDSIILSLLRRTGIPIFLFLRTNFIFLRGEDVIGEFNRKLTLLDRYVLDLTADQGRTFDRRLALALGVMLDTGERR
jgi:uncharacterized protein YxjI